MIKCTNCGSENPNDAAQCGACHTALIAQSPPTRPEPSSDHLLSLEERRFWERMTFRQFAILMIRLQAVWLMFYALIDVTYLPRYFPRPRGASSYYSHLYAQMNLDQFLAIFRIILHVAAAIALIQFAERVLAWLVKESFVKQTPNEPKQPTPR
jgi:hypothetical protein